ncbi:MAG TPA: hypothetical protein VH797_08345 [Nitrososphaeraceae archaeon]
MIAITKLVSTSLLTTLLIFSYSLAPINAHVFSGDESSSFISLADQIKSALMAIGQNNSSDMDAPKEHGRYARMLLNDSILKEINEKNERLATELPRALDLLQNISEKSDLNNNITRVLDLLSETIDSRVEKAQLENTTIQALAVAGDVDKVFKEYSAAFNQTAPEMAMNMSNMAMNMSMTRDNETNIEIPTIMEAYDRATVLVNVTIDRFEAELKGKSENVSSEENALSGLEHLREVIQNKERPTDLLGIVHGEIHPNLQIAFGLELAKAMSGQNNSSHSTQHQTKT